MSVDLRNRSGAADLAAESAVLAGKLPELPGERWRSWGICDHRRHRQAFSAGWEGPRRWSATADSDRRRPLFSRLRVQPL